MSIINRSNTSPGCTVDNLLVMATNGDDDPDPGLRRLLQADLENTTIIA